MNPDSMHQFFKWVSASIQKTSQRIDSKDEGTLDALRELALHLPGFRAPQRVAPTDPSGETVASMQGDSANPMERTRARRVFEEWCSGADIVGGRPKAVARLPPTRSSCERAVLTSSKPSRAPLIR